MSQATLRGGITDAMNELYKLIRQCNDSNQLYSLQFQYTQLNAQLESVIKTDLLTVFNSNEYQKAIDALNDSIDAINVAIEEANHIANAIQKVADAINKIVEVFLLLSRI